MFVQFHPVCRSAPPRCRARNLLHFDLLGHSLGATVAVALLERLSDPSAGGAGGAVGRLVLLSPAGVCAEPTEPGGGKFRVWGSDEGGVDVGVQSGTLIRHLEKGFHWVFHLLSL